MHLLSFVGLEVASYLAGKAKSVSVVGSGTSKVPFENVFGSRIGTVIKQVRVITHQ